MFAQTVPLSSLSKTKFNNLQNFYKFNKKLTKFTLAIVWCEWYRRNQQYPPTLNIAFAFFLAWCEQTTRTTNILDLD